MKEDREWHVRFLSLTEIQRLPETALAGRLRTPGLVGKVGKCTLCGSVRVEITPYDAWKDHDEEHEGMEGEPAEFLVVTLCGSMRFYSRMIELAGELTREGIIVLMPHATKGEANSEMLDKMHRAKMDMSSAIYVVTDSGNYVGESTRNEIAYAQRNSMRVNWDRGGKS